MNKVSIIIPSRNEREYLNNTIENVIENATGTIEIIAVLDGWEPHEPIQSNLNVKVIHHKEAKGQRASINHGVSMASGNYVMKLDAHCAVGKGFDEILARDCGYMDTLIPAMFNLDITTWKPKFFDDWEKAHRTGKFNPYMYIGWQNDRLRSLYYNGKKTRQAIWEAGKDKPVDETMTCMGPGFFMHKDRFLELGGMDESHGQWGQMGIEVACKAWLSGGRLLTDKNTWFAHYFRGGGVPEGHQKGFPYRILQRDIDKARTYSENLWLNDKWEKQIRPFEWLVHKFKPPTWNGNKSTPFKNKKEWFNGYGLERIKYNGKMYKHIHRERHLVEWKGIPVIKMPADLINYAEAIQETRPELIIEIGTKYGGSALYLQDMLAISGINGQVVTIDIKDNVKNKDSRIQYIIGNSLDESIIEDVHRIARGKKTMLIIDGNHNRKHVKWELHKYQDIVSDGCYLVIEDCYTDRGLWGPGEARDWFLENYKQWEQTDKCHKFVVGVTMGGWLKRK